MVPVVQLVRASDCGSECRGFESHRAPKEEDLMVFLFLYPAYTLFLLEYNIIRYETLKCVVRSEIKRIFCMKSIFYY